MTYTIPELDFVLKRDSAFSYMCNNCSRCCHRKAISVAPYEILRLARRLRVTTTEFIALYTEAGGTILRTREENDYACIFLDQNMCGVHGDRPFVCRIYPLGHRVNHDGNESFGRMTPHPETEGAYGISGSIDEYLSKQEVAPFLEVAERYGAVYERMVDRLNRLDPTEFENRADRQGTVDETEAGFAASPWIDIDQSITDFCRAEGRSIPGDIEGAVATHIEAINAWIDSLGA